VFFAKPRLSAVVINCADCSASLMSGSGRFVTSAPTSRSRCTRAYPTDAFISTLHFSSLRVDVYVRAIAVNHIFSNTFN